MAAAFSFAQFSGHNLSGDDEDNDDEAKFPGLNDSILVHATKATKLLVPAVQKELANHQILKLLSSATNKLAKAEVDRQRLARELTSGNLPSFILLARDGQKGAWKPNLQGVVILDDPIKAELETAMKALELARFNVLINANKNRLRALNTTIDNIRADAIKHTNAILDILIKFQPEYDDYKSDLDEQAHQQPASSQHGIHPVANWLTNQRTLVETFLNTVASQTYMAWELNAHRRKIASEALTAEKNAKELAAKTALAALSATEVLRELVAAEVRRSKSPGRDATHAGSPRTSRRPRAPSPRRPILKNETRTDPRPAHSDPRSARSRSRSRSQSREPKADKTSHTRSKSADRSRSRSRTRSPSGSSRSPSPAPRHKQQPRVNFKSQDKGHRKDHDGRRKK